MKANLLTLIYTALLALLLVACGDSIPAPSGFTATPQASGILGHRQRSEQGSDIGSHKRVAAA